MRFDALTCSNGNDAVPRLNARFGGRLIVHTTCLETHLHVICRRVTHPGVMRQNMMRQNLMWLGLIRMGLMHPGGMHRLRLHGREGGSRVSATLGRQDQPSDEASPSASAGLFLFCFFSRCSRVFLAASSHSL